MNNKGKVSKKNFRKICVIIVVAEIISCIAFPAMASTTKSEITYINTKVNSASYYHKNKNSNIENKYKDLVGKKVAIIGDSISTFKGYIPKDYRYFYSKGDVNKVEKTWWGQLSEKTGVDIVANCSWSGSTVTGDSTSKVSARAACSDKRIQDLSLSKEKLDIIICYIGINDYRRNVKVGQWTSEDEIPSESTNITSFSDGYALMISKIKKQHPEAKVYVTTLLECDDINNRATYDLSGYNDAIRQVADKFNLEVVELDQFMIEQNDFKDFSLDRLHPNAAGHERMSEKFAETLLK